MTKCIVLGYTPSVTKDLKPIEFNRYLNGDDLISTDDSPTLFDNLELISRDYFCEGFDLIFGYDDGLRNEGILYLGHWNDGIAV